MLRHAIAAAAVLAAAPLCQAGDEYEVKTLTIGDPAPSLDLAHWLKGEKIAAFEPGQAYVVEFWATWCGPCKASVPHLSELQHTYDDYGVTFIGISDEEPQKVVEFFAKTNEELGKTWADAMQFTVVADPDKSAHQAYMTAANMRGIPSAFLVGKDQKIEWIGRPHYPKGEMDRALDGVVHGTWDRAAFAKLYTMRKQLEREYAAGEHEKAITLANELIAHDPAGASIYQDQLFWTYLRLDRAAEAYAIGEILVKANWESAPYLNAMAWRVATEPDIKTRDLDLALKAALQANDLTHSRDAATLDTVARVFYEKGDLKSAVKWQRKAVAAVEADSNMAKDLKESLEKYEQES